jgi:hypothetical protein
MLDAPPDVGPEVVHQNKQTYGLNTGTDLQSQAVIAADRRTIRLTLEPVFQTASSQADVKLTAIPGGK